MPERDIKFCIPALQEVWNKASKEFMDTYPNLAKPMLTCTYRSNEEQAQLYNYPWDGIDNNKNGKIDEPGEKVTNAKAGQSYHNHSPARAFDVGFKKASGVLDWNLDLFHKFASIAKKYHPNLGWGGDWKKFKDYPHFEIKPGHDEVPNA